MNHIHGKSEWEKRMWRVDVTSGSERVDVKRGCLYT